MLSRLMDLLGTQRKSRRHRAFSVKQADVEMLEQRALLSTVKLVSNIAGSATMTATDKSPTDRDAPQTLNATWDSNGVSQPKAQPGRSGLSAVSGATVSGANVVITPIADKNPAFSFYSFVGGGVTKGVASFDVGTGVRRGDPVTLKIIPQTDEEDGQRVRVTLTASAWRWETAFTNHFEISYRLDGETVTIASGVLPTSALKKDVVFEAEIGDEFDVAFSIEGNLSLPKSSLLFSGHAGLQIKVEPIKVDLVATALAWDPTKGGVSFKYAIKDGSLPATTRPKVELFWATGTKTIGNPIPLTGFTAQTKQGEYSFNVPGNKLRTVPKGATHMILVLDRPNAIKEASETNNAKNVADVAIRLGPDVEGVVKVPTVAILKRLQRDAGQATITITSMERTPLRQAQVMFDNCLTQGAASQLGKYKAAGAAVIQVYIAQTKGLSKTQISAKRNTIVNLMLKKIQSFKPMSQVSHHIVDGNALQVVDIAPSSFSTSLAKGRFISSAIEAQRSKLISHIIKPGEGEKAIHLEIPL